jgi:serine/threonine-protein kinase
MTADGSEHDHSTRSVAVEHRYLHRDALEHARFAPGEVFASRYRIVSLLGRGGMGEVYRADDLKVGQRVALKLLSLQSTPFSSPTERFVGEVRMSRSITHPNVCRVFDIGEADGWHYLSMEYVDGETLASLRRRIGRLPVEKAIDIARQLCAGLTSAHELGILHRDLKPANVMVDGRGYVRIMDFGLAVRSDVPMAYEVAGTPGYMAPELIAGGRATVQSDLYSLGHVLYELFCGRKYGPDGEYPSDIDVRITAVINACMAIDPTERPRSSSAVAAALSGMDQLAAALADGRVLSPNMVAAAADAGALRPPIAWSLLIMAIAGIAAVAMQAHRLTFSRRDVPKSPEVLAERARELLADLGYATDVVDHEFWLTSHGTGTFRIRSVYRQSAQYLIPRNLFHQVLDDDPPDLPGTATVNLMADGRLLSLKVTSKAGAHTDSPSADANWEKVFSAAGLMYSEFERVAPAHTSAVPHDTELAFRKRAERSPVITVAAASLNGQPVFFESADSLAPTRHDVLTTFRSSGVEAVLSLSIALAFVGAAILARRHLRSREGDRVAARKLAAFVAVGGVLMAILRAHHVPVLLAEWTLVLGSTGWALVWAAFSWLTYVALEPYVRRQFPSTLISWTRALNGRWRDPLVGRDVLVGIVVGTALVLLLAAHIWLTNNPSPDVFARPALENVRSPRHVIGALAFAVTDSLQFALGGLFLVVLLRILFRRTWLAAAVCMVLVMPLSSGIPVHLGGPVLAREWMGSLVIGGLVVTTLLRFGLLTTYVALTVERMATRVPLTADVRAWYLEFSLAIVILLGALATYGFLIALSGRPAGRLATSDGH